MIHRSANPVRLIAHRPAGRRAGVGAFTLIETMLCLLVVAIVGAGAMTAVSEVLGLKARIELEQRTLRDARELLDVIAAKPVERLVGPTDRQPPEFANEQFTQRDRVLDAFPTLSALAGVEPMASVTSLSHGVIVIESSLARAAVFAARSGGTNTAVAQRDPWNEPHLEGVGPGPHYRVRVVEFDGLPLSTAEVSPGFSPRVLLVEVAAWQASRADEPGARRLFTLRTLRTTAWDMALGMRPFRAEAPPGN